MHKYRMVDRNTRTPLPNTALALALALVLVLASGNLRAEEICRWVDGNGRTQMATTVPDAYKHSAICISSKKFELSPEQQRDADRRAASEKVKNLGRAVDPSAAPSPEATRPASGATPPQAKRPAESVTDATDCTTWWRLYDESSECFGSFRLVGGGIKPEAFEHCHQIPSPVPKCGPRRD